MIREATVAKYATVQEEGERNVQQLIVITFGSDNALEESSRDFIVIQLLQHIRERKGNGMANVYLSSFQFSQETVNNPNIYPYNVFADKHENVLFFCPITILYGNNASGKSTMLNIIANKLQLEGQEYATSNKYGNTQYFMKFVEKCNYTLGEDEDGKRFSRVPSKSRYVKSEDILYEIKKIQQEQVLDDGYVYEHVRRGMPKGQIESLRNSTKMKQQMEYIKFAQEKYSNGETTFIE